MTEVVCSKSGISRREPRKVGVVFCTLWECSALHSVHMKTRRAFGPWKPQNTKPDNCDHPFANMHCKTRITYSSCSAWRWCTVRFIDQMGCYARPFGLGKGVWLGPCWQLRWRSLSGPGGGAPDSYIPPIWRHHHPPAALHSPSSPHTSLFTQQNQSEWSPSNHVALSLERVFSAFGVTVARRMCQKPLLGHLLPSVFAVCNKMTKYRAISPFLCMDMTYITCLLKEGFGFKDSTVLQVRKCPSPPWYF